MVRQALEGLDVYLNVYVPILQTGGGRDRFVASYLHQAAIRWIRGPGHRRCCLSQRRVKSETFRARFIRFGLRDQVVAIAWNEGLRARVPAPVWERVGSLVHAIETGALEVSARGVLSRCGSSPFARSWVGPRSSSSPRPGCAAGTKTLCEALGPDGWALVDSNPARFDAVASVVSFREDLDRIEEGLVPLLKDLDSRYLDRLLGAVRAGTFGFLNLPSFSPCRDWLDCLAGLDRVLAPAPAPQVP